MKILHLSHGDSIGGAARYARRIHDSLLGSGIESEMWVSSRKSPNSNIYTLGESHNKLWPKYRAKVAQRLDSLCCEFEYTQTRKHRSPGWVGALSSRKVNASNSEILHAHWINGGLISIRQFGKIRKPIVWSMLDMWPFMGSEHYAIDDMNSRWIKGFYRSPRDPNDSGIDICAISAKQKRKYWGNFHPVVPGNWMLGQVQKSSLLNHLTPIVIPPALDTITFSPLDKKMAKEQLGFPSDVVVIGYGGGTSGRKGWNFFQQIVSYNFSESSKIAFLVFGTEFFPASISNQNTVIKLGKIQNVEELRLAYSGMDLLLMPSIMDAYGLIAQEAQSCGVPVICFDNTGVADVIDKEVTGVAVRHLNAGAMIHEISTLLKNPERLKAMTTSARDRATKNWRYDIVSRQYIELYSEILQSES